MGELPSIDMVSLNPFVAVTIAKPDPIFPLLPCIIREPCWILIREDPGLTC